MSQPSQAQAHLTKQASTIINNNCYSNTIEIKSLSQTTTYLFNRRLGTTGNSLLSVSLGLISGLMLGYTRSLVFCLHEKGATLAQQAELNFIFYPNVYRLLVAPLVDLYYWRSFGRTKSFLVPLSIANCILLILAAEKVDALLEQTASTQVTVWFFAIMQLHVLFSSAGDSLMKTVEFESEFKKIMQVREMGSMIGDFMGFNFFLVMNSPGFLESLLGKNKLLSAVFVSHKLFLLIFAGIYGAFGLLLLFLYGEPLTETQHDKPTFESVIRLFPAICKSKENRLLVCYLLLNRSFRSAVTGTLQLKFMEYGISKAQISAADTLTFPLVAIAVCLFFSTSNRNTPAMTNHKISIGLTLIYLWKYLILRDLRDNQNKLRTFILLAATSVIEKIVARGVYFGMFLNRISQANISSTYLSIYYSIINASLTLPSSAGFYLSSCSGFSYDMFAVSFLILQLGIMAYQYEYASSLDGKDKEAFRIANTTEETEISVLLSENE